MESEEKERQQQKRMMMEMAEKRGKEWRLRKGKGEEQRETGNERETGNMILNRGW